MAGASSRMCFMTQFQPGATTPRNGSNGVNNDGSSPVGFVASLALISAYH